MMKNETIKRLSVRVFFVMTLLLCLGTHALAYDVQSAEAWLDQFAQALTALSPVNDPARTVDPARAGEFLLEYEFGTVRSAVSANPDADTILEIDVRTSQVTDCRGVRVGMELSSVMGGSAPAYSDSPLYVISAHENGYGWNWAYMSEEGIYGVEYIAYGECGAGMKEYTLTYVIENDIVSAIRMKVADATLAQAQDGMKTAQEIASRQNTLIAANTSPLLVYENLQIMGRQALGAPVAQLVAGMGEPLQIQTLAHGAGRVLVYDGAVVTLGFNELTGEEIVCAVSVSSDSFEGPNGLKVGMTLQEAGSLVRCDTDMYRGGGTLYLGGEAQGEAPYGELRLIGDNEMMLVYACAAKNDIALLQVIASGGVVASWQMLYQSDMQDGV